MNIRTQTKDILRTLLGRYGYEIVPRNAVFDWQTGDSLLSRIYPAFPETAPQPLDPGHPSLLDLQTRYEGYQDYPSGEVSVWDPDRVRPDDLLQFRGHNAYLFQEGRCNRNPFGYLLAYYYLKSIDRCGLLEVLEEDGAFGAVTYLVDQRPVSRDLLDSILEIYFLEEHWGLLDRDDLVVLDIGAGYGRLAHRMAAALPGLERYLCTDAIPQSTFLSEYYLNFRGLAHKTRVIPLDRVVQDLEPYSIDLAVNIHCFSECPAPAIEWWMDLLEKKRVPALMVVPNSAEGLLTNEGLDFQPIIEERGYRLAVRQPKYLDPVVQRYALNPDYFHLFLRD